MRISSTETKTFFICIVCGESRDESGNSVAGVHHFYPADGCCKKCDCPYLVESKSRVLPEDEIIAKLRRKYWNSPVKPKPVSFEQGSEIMAKKAVKKPAAESKIPHGKKTGLRLGEWWVHIFEENAKAKNTDDQIRKMFAAEFPDAPSKLNEEIRSGVLHRIQAIRNRYNKGGLTGGVAPRTLSHRYDENGNYNDTKFSGKAGVTLEDLDTRYIPKAEKKVKTTTVKTAKKDAKPAKSVKKAKVVVCRKKKEETPSDKSESGSAAASS